MARFQVTGGGWPVGSHLVPPDTIISSDDWTYGGIPLPEALPLNLRPLDDESYQRLLRYHQRYEVLPPPPPPTE